jgi:hypothetical protein
MKAEEAKQLVIDYKNNLEELRVSKIKERIDSKLYDPIFNQIKEEAKKGRTCIFINTTHPKVVVHIVEDLSHLGYNVSGLIPDPSKDIRSFQITWGTS